MHLFVDIANIYNSSLLLQIIYYKLNNICEDNAVLRVYSVDVNIYRSEARIGVLCDVLLRQK